MKLLKKGQWKGWMKFAIRKRRKFSWIRICLINETTEVQGRFCSLSEKQFSPGLLSGAHAKAGSSKNDNDNSNSLANKWWSQGLSPGGRKAPTVCAFSHHAGPPPHRAHRARLLQRAMACLSTMAQLYIISLADQQLWKMSLLKVRCMILALHLLQIDISKSEIPSSLFPKSSICSDLFLN